MSIQLLLVWRFAEKGQPIRTLIHDFQADGEMSVLVREVAAAIELIDPNAKALYEGVIGDLEGEILRLKNQLAFFVGVEKVGVLSA